MGSMNERPICHRAEDLVTYLYGEATADEAQDFAMHRQDCDACGAEFAMFNQVHDSIVSWRSEALGSGFAPAASPVTQPVSVSAPLGQRERKLSALAALREFFTVSPLWLRGATAVAGLLLCVLLVFAASSLWQKPAEVVKSDSNPVFDQKKFDEAVRKQVAEELAGQKELNKAPETVIDSRGPNPRPQLANNRVRSKSQQAKGLSRQEREQLAADLGLIPGRDDELPFVFPEEPNQ